MQTRLDPRIEHGPQFHLLSFDGYRPGETEDLDSSATRCRRNHCPHTPLPNSLNPAKYGRKGGQIGWRRTPMIRMTALAAIFIQSAMTAALATQVLLYSPQPGDAGLTVPGAFGTATPCSIDGQHHRSYPLCHR